MINQKMAKIGAVSTKISVKCGKPVQNLKSSKKNIQTW